MTIGTVTVSVSGTDNVAVTKVEWYFDNKLMGSKSGSTASFSWQPKNIARTY